MIKKIPSLEWRSGRLEMASSCAIDHDFATASSGCCECNSIYVVAAF